MGGGPADGRYTKGLFRGSRLRLPYLVGTLRSRACSQFRVVAPQTRLFPVVVLACWNDRCLGSDDDSGQPASTCGQERLKKAKAAQENDLPISSSSPRTPALRRPPCRFYA